MPGNPAKVRRSFPDRSKLSLTNEMLAVTWRWHLLSYWGRRRRATSSLLLQPSYLEALRGDRVFSPGGSLLPRSSGSDLSSSSSGYLSLDPISPSFSPAFFSILGRGRPLIVRGDTTDGLGCSGSLSPCCYLGQTTGPALAKASHVFCPDWRSVLDAKEDSCAPLALLSGSALSPRVTFNQWLLGGKVSLRKGCLLWRETSRHGKSFG